MKRLLILLTTLNMFNCAFAEPIEYLHKVDIPYYSAEQIAQDPYRKERALLDVYCPKNQPLAPTIVWIHGGGLWKGNKYLPKEYKNKGVCVVAVSYRLSPQVTYPAYIEDAAAAVAWVFKNIQDYGGDAKQIFISGHSAGGYLTAMVGFDKKWLKPYQVDANDLAGIFLLSSKLSTLAIVRNTGDDTSAPVVIDEKAPLYYARADLPPLWLITGDRELDLPGNYEENALLFSRMKALGHQATKLHELGGFGHQITVAAFPLVLEQVKKTVAATNSH